MSKEVFMFPGQGSQSIGMTKDVLDNPIKYANYSAIFDGEKGIETPRDVYRIAQEIYSGMGGDVDFMELAHHGPQVMLDLTQFTQPATYISEVIGLGLTNQVPDAVAGHSLGEYGALAAAKVVNFEDGLKLVIRRGEIMNVAGINAPGGMAAVLSFSDEQVSEMCEEIATQTGEIIVPANYNTPGNVVISGSREAIAFAETFALEFAERMGVRRAKIIKLPISIAAHSPLMADARTQMSSELDQVSFNRPEIAFISATKPELGFVDDEEIIKLLMSAQLTGGVMWSQTLKKLRVDGFDTFSELGPGTVLGGTVKRTLREKPRPAFSSQDI